jgi:hypothetical protein
VQKKVYPIRPIDPFERRDKVREIEIELKSWRDESANFIDLKERARDRYFILIQSRALQLAFANLEILLYRAYLLDDIQYYTQNSFVRLFGADWDKEAADKVEKCLDAALRTTEMIDGFSREVKNFKASWVCKSPAYGQFLKLTVV